MVVLFVPCLNLMGHVVWLKRCALFRNCFLGLWNSAYCLPTMNRLSKSFEGVAPSCPKPSLQRPTLLRSCAAKLTRSLETEKKAGPAAAAATNKGDLDTDRLASQLIKNALAEDAHLAGEDDMLCESEDEGFDEMDDDVLSLCGQSESEMSEGEGDLEDLAYSFAKGVVRQGVDIDFAKAVQDASEETAAVKDFVEISDFASEAENEERNEEDLKDFYDLSGSGQDGLGKDEFEVETVQAKDITWRVHVFSQRNHAKSLG